MLWLYDSRARSVNGGKRIVHKFPLTSTGVTQAWRHTVDSECPDEWDDYQHFAENSGEWCTEESTDITDNNDGCAIFNEYWSCYGWYLATVDDRDEDEITTREDLRDVIWADNTVPNVICSGCGRGWQTTHPHEGWVCPECEAAGVS